MKLDELINNLSSEFLLWHHAPDESWGAWIKRRVRTPLSDETDPMFLQDWALTKDLTEAEFQQLVMMLKLQERE